MEEEIEIDLIQKLLLGEDIQKLPPDVHKFFETYNILNKIIKKDLVFEHGTGTGIFFLNCIFEGSVRFEAKEFKSGIVACNCKFMKGIAFSDGDYSGSIEISSKVEKSITLSGGNYKRIELDCECEALSIGNCKVDGLYIQGTVSKRIRINHIQYNGIGFSGNIFFSEIIVDKLEFEWFLRKDSEIFIKGINVRELRISKFINDGKLRIFDLSALTINVNGEIANQAVSSDVYILDSYLGNAELYNINFKEFNKVIIRNSLLTGCSFINVIWPKDVLTNINENKTAKEVNNDKKEVYKQIKYALSKQGDNVTEQQFHGLEMNIYNKTLSFRNDFWTKIILYLSYFTIAITVKVSYVLLSQ
ncbi:MAG: hypothetical protein WKG06_07605 [Segetibacter sp.]